MLCHRLHRGNGVAGHEARHPGRRPARCPACRMPASSRQGLAGFAGGRGGRRHQERPGPLLGLAWRARFWRSHRRPRAAWPFGAAPSTACPAAPSSPTGRPASGSRRNAPACGPDGLPAGCPQPQAPPCARTRCRGCLARAETQAQRPAPRARVAELGARLLGRSNVNGLQEGGTDAGARLALQGRPAAGFAERGAENVNDLAAGPPWRAPAAPQTAPGFPLRVQRGLSLALHCFLEMLDVRLDRQADKQDTRTRGSGGESAPSACSMSLGTRPGARARRACPCRRLRAGPAPAGPPRFRRRRSMAVPLRLWTGSSASRPRLRRQGSRKESAWRTCGGGSKGGARPPAKSAPTEALPPRCLGSEPSEASSPAVRCPRRSACPSLRSRRRRQPWRRSARRAKTRHCPGPRLPVPAQGRQGFARTAAVQCPAASPMPSPAGSAGPAGACAGSAGSAPASRPARRADPGRRWRAQAGCRTAPPCRGRRRRTRRQAGFP